MDNSTFIEKLYSLVNDDTISEIEWSKTGAFFSIPNPEEFSKILPSHFKHSNFASFVRQLNMYGFHKVADLSQLSLSGRSWAFQHPGFSKHQPELLETIIRKPKSSQKKTPAEVSDKTLGKARELLPKVYNDEQKKKARLLVEEYVAAQQRQKQINQKFTQVKRQQEVLWNEYSLSQQKLYEQSQVTKQVLNFLSTIYQHPSLPYNTPPPNSLQLIQDLSDNMSDILIDSNFSDEMDIESPQKNLSFLEFNTTMDSPNSSPLLIHESNNSELYSSSFENDFLDKIIQFEDQNPPPYCSMEETQTEQKLRNGINTPAGHVWPIRS